MDAILHSDVGTLRRIYADDYVQTGADDNVTTKEQQLAEVENGLRRITVLTRDELNVRTSEDTAIVIDLGALKGTVAGHHA